MKVIILTSSLYGIASRVLPELCKNNNIEVIGVILAHGTSSNRNKNIRRIIKKIWKIGLLGALNGIRIRKWYVDHDVDDIHSLCNSLGVDLHETPFINCDTTRKLFREVDADLGLSLGNGYISESIFSIPKNGMINIHMEILPEFQGAQSIIWPIYEGRVETGFTIHNVDSLIDHGYILYQEKYPIEFCPTLRETVEKGLKTARGKVPKAFSYVCENYVSIKMEAMSQTKGKSYTTPSIWSFIKMLINNHAFYKKSLTWKI